MKHYAKQYLKPIVKAEFSNSMHIFLKHLRIILVTALLFTLVPAADSLPAANLSLEASDDDFRIARIQYRGGGDWYNDPSALTNLIRYTRQHVPISLSERYDDVPIGSRDLHRYAFAFMTGHGDLSVNQSEANNIREYVDNGGFLYIDDDYGFDPYVREFLSLAFPDDDLVELPFDHPIYSQVFNFPEGLPKIHEHDGKPSQGFGIFRNGRLAVYYTYETNLADGWAYDVHNPPEDIRIRSLRMGVNLLVYAFTSER